MNASFWRGKRVFITGHTGFKGGWLSIWLQSLGAEVHGFALPPATNPNLFETAGVEKSLCGHTLGDLADRTLVATALRDARPEIVFHLAAQALVRQGYASPVETYATNVMGTVHLLQTIRDCPTVKAVVNVTTDKCYENREWEWGYRENDALGGADPYASSKACSELVTAAFRRSFLESSGVGVATARAGNVIGGGDWSPDRLLPDAFRALDSQRALEIRAPGSVRPWQHVLEPLAGYLLLAEALCRDPKTYSGAWNFGPSDTDARSVAEVLKSLSKLEPAFHWTSDAKDHPHEAGVLRLDSSRARLALGWRPRWNLEEALARTAEWHQLWRQGRAMAECCTAQIRAYGEHQPPPSGQP